MSLMLTKRDAGNAKRKRKFAQARRLIRIESIALPSEVTDREDKEDGLGRSAWLTTAYTTAR
jgi:hypothetical protein